jgi:hypothetical protein
MTIEIHQPELEALIADGMQSGGYATVEDYLLHALRGTPLQAEETKPKSNPPPGNATGALLVTALQACPYPDVELIRPSAYFSVRDVELE